jgi:putative methionine-R-sulfoxide reductase with GAF domain
MFKTQPKPKELIPQLDILAAKSTTLKDLMTEVVALLHQNLLKYNWVGFYMIDEKDKNMLELGPFKGSMTPHTRIPLNQGICGAAASTGKTVVVDDVNADSRYLACSTETKSEIVWCPSSCAVKCKASSTSTAISPPRLAPKTATCASTPPNSLAAGWNPTNTRGSRVIGPGDRESRTPGAIGTRSCAGVLSPPKPTPSNPVGGDVV